MFDLNQDIAQQLYLFATSFLFGLGQWMMKIRKNEIKKNKFDFFSELLFAQLSGYITFRICQYFVFGFNLTWILVAINSWSGSKFLDVFQKISSNFIAQKFGIDTRHIKDDDVERVARRQRVREQNQIPLIRPMQDD